MLPRNTDARGIRVLQSSQVDDPEVVCPAPWEALCTRFS